MENIYAMQKGVLFEYYIQNHVANRMYQLTEETKRMIKKTVSFENMNIQRLKEIIISIEPVFKN
jgi:hypothetical protein